jgi:putative transposase
LPISDRIAVVIRRHEKTGRPPGNDDFVIKLESATSRVLKPKKPGRKPKK